MVQWERKRLLVSIHDVGPAFASEVEQLAERLSARLGGYRFAMLVVPDHWDAHPLAADRAFCARLRNWADGGVEMFLHGWCHRDTAAHSGLTGFKARHMTASEGEFLGLSAAEAGRRMAAGKALVEDIIGRPLAGFIAPAWLYGQGAMEALAEGGFALAEDHWRVWRPDTGATLARGPVVTWASRSPMRTASSLAFAAVARTALRPLETVRIAVHPGDTSKPSLLASIDRSLDAFAMRRNVSRYSALLD
jgi:predicted deacetylase